MKPARLLKVARLIPAMFLLLCAGCNSGVPQGSSVIADNLPAETEAPNAAVDPLHAPGPLSLPPPVQLLPGHFSERSTSYVPADLWREAEDFIPGFPRQRSAATAAGCSFTPDWTAGDKFAGLSYVTYAFEIDGYDLNDELRFSWLTPPPDGALWIALADWGKNRWQWFKAEADANSVEPADLDPFISFGGDLLAVVLLTGNEPAELDWLRVGTELPAANIVCTGPSSGYSILETSFDASASSDPDGSIVKYDWDWQGDGSFDNTSGSNPVAAHTFAGAGDYNVTVRVTDDDGARSTASTSVSVLAGWQHSIGGPGSDSINAIARAPDGSIWACGQSSVNAAGKAAADVLLLHFSAAGQLLHDIRWVSEDAEGHYYTARDLLVDSSSGSVYVIGGMLSPSANGALFQRWSADGELEVCSRFDEASGVYESLFYSGAELYACGFREPGPDSRHACWLAISKDGVAGSGTQIQTNSRFHDMVMEFPDVVVDPVRIYACGIEYDADEGDPFHDEDAFVCLAELEAGVTQLLSWGGSSTSERALWIRRSGFALSAETLVGLGFIDSGLGHGVAGIARLNASSFNAFALSGGFGAKEFSQGGRGRVICGSNIDGAALVELDFDNLLIQCWQHSGSLIASCAAAYSSGSVLVGGDCISADGAFEAQPAGPQVQKAITWTTESHTSSGFSAQTSVMSTQNLAVREPMVLDAGGGIYDAWLGLVFLPQP